MAPATADLSPIWQSLPVELVQQVFHELVSIHLREIRSNPYYPWEALRQLNHEQRRRIDAVYRQLLLPILDLERHGVFYPTTGITEGRFHRGWVWEEGEAYDSTKDTITLRLRSRMINLSLLKDVEDDWELDWEEGHDTSKGWNKYVNSFAHGGLRVNPEPCYYFGLKLSSTHRLDHLSNSWYKGLEGLIPASHVPDVQDDSDDDSITVSSSQLIGALIRAWKKRNTEEEL
ncbi:hypothetical protein QBC32DRAFT_122327 [Pseudoneurospora amorphoporcata]|uniref:Uncharacterized protein n=1 Tax=Pseudoneurospora amorphoporcata TaxID=241081 RepID=A0AAN6SAR4_9PEZI|nr:hypothetical protein QBC32DRAFT_122327 [Pseudoneurospora amorphoporcata]